MVSHRLSIIKSRVKNLGQYALKGAIPWNKGKKGVYSEKTLRKMRAIKVGKKLSGVVKEKISNSLKGRIKSKEHRKKIGKAHLGKKFNIETRLKMSKAKKGIRLSEKHKKKIAESAKASLLVQKNIERLAETNKGREISRKQRRILSEVMKGERNHQWLGGKSFEPYSPEFNKNLKLRIRKRDNYTCRECGYTEEELGYILRIHHIDYNKKNNKENNLISLCRNCHAQTNFNREDWTKYFQGIIYDQS